MTTTDQNVDIYTALENLKGVRMSHGVRETIDGVQAVTDYARPFIENARAVMTDLEVNGQIVQAHLLEGLDLAERGDVEQGLWDLMQELSGARELFNAMQELSELCDPDRMCTPDAIAEARAAKDLERMSPEARRMVFTPVDTSRAATD